MSTHPHKRSLSPPRTLLSELNESLSHEHCRRRHYQLLQSPVFYEDRLGKIAEEITKLLRYQDRIKRDRSVAASMIDQIDASILSLQERILHEQQKQMALVQQARLEKPAREASTSPPSPKSTLGDDLATLGNAAAWASTNQPSLLSHLDSPEGRLALTSAYKNRIEVNHV